MSIYCRCSMVAAKACIYCILCSSFFVHTAFSQEIRGTVRDEAGARLPGVHVTLADLNTGTVTDEQGQYTLSNLGAGEYLVSFSFIGFITQTRRVRIDTNNIELDVSLVADVLEADEVLIVEDRVDVLTRDSRSVSVLEPEDLVELRGQTLGETLEQLPGVTALQTGPSISKPVVRGLHSQRVLVLNAGISQEGQQWGGEHAPEIDPFAPVRIEVIKGVAGVEYGIGAIGGVIKLDPLELPYVPGHGVDGQLSLNGFSNNFQGAGALYLEGTASSIPGMGWRVQTSFRKAGDAHTPDYVIRNSAFREFNGSVSAGIKRDRISLVALASRFSTELGIFSGAHIGNINDLLRAIALDEPSFIGDFGYDIGPPKQNISHNLLSVHGDYHFDSGSWLELQYGFQVNRRREFDAHGRNNDDPSALEDAAFDFSLTSNTLELKFHHKPMGQFFGVMGVSGMSQLNKNAATGLLIPNYRAYSGGVFARESWVKDKLTLEAGARFDFRFTRAWPRENGSSGNFVKRINENASLSGVLGGIWQFSSSWSLGMNLGTGWRPPGVNELHNFGVHHGSAQFEIGNPDLGNERSVGLDATLRHNSEKTRFELSAYNNSFDGFIFLFPQEEPRVTIRGTFLSFEYSQADAVLRGIETSFERDIVDWLTMSMQYSIVRANNLDTDEPLINMPSDRGTVKAQFNLPTSKRIQDTHIDLEGVFVAKQTRVPDNVDYAAPPDGYMLYNVSISTKLMMSNSSVRLNLALHNVFNTAYRDYLSRFRYFIDDPGRSLILRAQIPLGREH